MTDNGDVGSTIPRRSLGKRLRLARQNARMTLTEAAEHLNASTAKLRRIESGMISSKVGDVHLLCTIYGVPDDLRDNLLELAKETRAKGWWHAYGDVVPEWFKLFMVLETTANRIRVFEPLLVPGLLQSREYIRAVIRADRPELTEEEIEARIEIRQSRQKMLTRPFPDPATIDVIITESVLLAEPAEGVMREQIWHLMQATEQPKVSVRVLPSSVGPHRASVAGSFTMLDFPDDSDDSAPNTVYSESLTGALYLDKPAEFEAYELAWEELDRRALSQEDSITMMGQRLKELNERER